MGGEIKETNELLNDRKNQTTNDIKDNIQQEQLPNSKKETTNQSTTKDNKNPEEDCPKWPHDSELGNSFDDFQRGKYI